MNKFVTEESSYVDLMTKINIRFNEYTFPTDWDIFKERPVRVALLDIPFSDSSDYTKLFYAIQDTLIKSELSSFYVIAREFPGTRFFLPPLEVSRNSSYSEFMNGYKTLFDSKFLDNWSHIMNPCIIFSFADQYIIWDNDWLFMIYASFDEQNIPDAIQKYVADAEEIDKDYNEFYESFNHRKMEMGLINGFKNHFFSGV